MAKCYVKAFFDWIEQVSALEDDEKGRLFVAILEYARSGEVPDMQGRESILFPVFKSQIDRDMESCTKQSENGKKGGRPRTKTESEENQNKPKQTKRKPTKANKEEEKEKDKEKDKDKEEETLCSLPREILGLAGFQVSDNAKQAQLEIKAKLEQEGFSCSLEIPVDDRGDGTPGRVDLIAEKDGITTAIEIDRDTPREKSIFKVGGFDCCKAVLVRNGKGRNTWFLDNGTAIIYLSIAADVPRLEGVSPQLEAAFADWLQYKHERREDYKPTGLKALQTQIINNAARYGEQAVIDLIRECMGNNWRGIIFDKLDERRGGSRRNQDNGFQTSNPFLEMLHEGGGVP